MAQGSPAFSHPSPETSHPFLGWEHNMWTRLSMQRGRGGPGSSLGAQAGAGGACHHAGEARGLAGRLMQRACCPSWDRGRRETHREGGDERGLGDWAGKVQVCPNHPPPRPRSASSPPRAHRTSGNFPLPSFHPSVHRPQGAAVLSSDLALCDQALGCPGRGADPERPAVFRGASDQDTGTPQPRAPVKSSRLQEPCHLQPRTGLSSRPTATCRLDSF